MVKILREAPYFAKLEYKRKQDGNTPLATACEEDNGDVVEYLLSEGDNSDENVGIHENNFYDRTPMLLSAREGSDDSIQNGFLECWVFGSKHVILGRFGSKKSFFGHF